MECFLWNNYNSLISLIFQCLYNIFYFLSITGASVGSDNYWKLHESISLDSGPSYQRLLLGPLANTFSKRKINSVPKKNIEELINKWGSIVWFSHNSHYYKFDLIENEFTRIFSIKCIKLFKMDKLKVEWEG